MLGQFFTSPSLAIWMVKFAVSFIDNCEAALDPACGDGVFLQAMLSSGFKRIVGIDVDEKVLQGCANLVGNCERLQLRCDNALLLLTELEGQFDLVATNPPFSAKYGRVTEPLLLRRFELGRGRNSEAIEVLFLELCVRSLRENGILAIVLPEGVFANLPQKRVREWLIRHTTPIAVISLSRSFFAAKSCVLFAQRRPSSLDELVLLSHVETEGDLQAIQKSGVKKRVGDLIDDMAPLHHLNRLDLNCIFPLQPLKTLLVEMRGGSAEYGVRRKFAESGIPFISAKTVTPFGIDLSRDGRFVQKGSFMDKPQAYTKVGDVVFVRVGVGCIGRAAVVLYDDETGVADDYLYILRFRTDLLLPEFFALLTQTKFFKQQLERFKRGTGTVTVPQKLLREILVPVAPMSVQQKFAHAYRQFHERYRKGLATAKELERLVDKLEQVLRGEDNAEDVR
ncbi:MAG: N-6 DNA methylase [Armatimonadota bacterium]|nr:N-6 DNA methylase [Armatimonadota bacterium]